MIINVSGKNIKIGTSLKNYIEERLKASAQKYLTAVTRAEIVISKQTYLFHADILIHDSTIGDIKASGSNDEVYAAFDSTLIKMEKILRKHKGKIRKKGKREAKEDGASTEKNMFTATKYVISNEISDEEEIANDEPITIAEQLTDIVELTVSEAIMQMDLNNLPALLFMNKANGRLNVIYYRKDGNISWVDPENFTI